MFQTADTMADSFAVLGATTVTNTGTTTVYGNVGVSPGTAVTGYTNDMITDGALHLGDAAATQAHSDMATVYAAAAGMTMTTILSGQDLGGMTLTPGVYRFASSAALSGQLILDAQGNPNAVFVFQIGSTLTTASYSSVIFVNGGQGNAVFWQVGSSATIGTYTSLTGSLLAYASITLTTGASILYGRAFALTGAITMDTNKITIRTES
jgi:type VI secretion system secreted protein VgrG